MKKSDILNWIMRVSNESRKERKVKNETLQKDKTIGNKGK